MRAEFTPSEGAGNEIRRVSVRKIVAWLVLGFMLGGVLYRLFR